MGILTSGQQRLLQAFGDRDFFRSNFVLTGGTALAAFYLQHRLSEDLDLFTGDPAAAARMRVELEGVAAGQDLAIEIARSVPTLLEADVRCGDEHVALHLALDAPYRLEPPVERADSPLPVDSALDLAANKLAALYGRASAKDFVDIYFVHHEIIALDDLLPKAAQKSPGIEPYWLARAFLQVRHVAMLPKMLRPMTLDLLQQFFVAQAERLMAKGTQA
jgi:hypothetical protein